MVAAGSVRPEGRYRVARPGPVRDIPAWLLEPLTPFPRIPVGPRTPVRLPHGRAAAYVRGAIDRETAQVAAAAPGTSHATLLAAAGKLGQLVGAGAALLTAATAHIGKWSCDCTEQSIRRTIDDGLRYGQQLPRRLHLIGPDPHPPSGAGDRRHPPALPRAAPHRPSAAVPCRLTPHLGTSARSGPDRAPKGTVMTPGDHTPTPDLARCSPRPSAPAPQKKRDVQREGSGADGLPRGERRAARRHRRDDRHNRPSRRRRR